MVVVLAVVNQSIRTITTTIKVTGTKMTSCGFNIRCFILQKGLTALHLCNRNAQCTIIAVHYSLEIES